MISRWALDIIIAITFYVIAQIVSFEGFVTVMLILLFIEAIRRTPHQQEQ